MPTIGFQTANVWSVQSNCGHPARLKKAFVLICIIITITNSNQDALGMVCNRQHPQNSPSFYSDPGPDLCGDLLGALGSLGTLPQPPAACRRVSSRELASATVLFVAGLSCALYETLSSFSGFYPLGASSAPSVTTRTVSTQGKSPPGTKLSALVNPCSGSELSAGDHTVLLPPSFPALPAPAPPI